MAKTKRKVTHGTPARYRSAGGRPGRRFSSRTLIVAGAIAFLAIGGVVAAVVLTNGGGPQPQPNAAASLVSVPPPPPSPPAASPPPGGPFPTSLLYTSAVAKGHATERTLLRL